MSLFAAVAIAVFGCGGDESQPPRSSLVRVGQWSFQLPTGTQLASRPDGVDHDGTARYGTSAKLSPSNGTGDWMVTVAFENLEQQILTLSREEVASRTAELLSLRLDPWRLREGVQGPYYLIEADMRTEEMPAAANPELTASGYAEIRLMVLVGGRSLFKVIARHNGTVPSDVIEDILSSAREL